MLSYYKTTIEDMDVAFFFVPVCTLTATDVKPPHYHLNYEVHHLLSGTQSYVIEEETYAVDEGSLLIIPPNLLHLPVGNSVNAIRFSFEFSISKSGQVSGSYKKWRRLIEEGLSRPVLLNVPIPEFVELQKVFQGRYNLPGYLLNLTENLIHSYLSIIFFKLLFEIVEKQNISEASRLFEEPVGFDGAPARVVHVSQYISSNYNANPSIKELAKELNLSVRQTERLIKNDMNASFSSLLNEHRIKIARYIIQNSVINAEHKSLNEISEHLGFSKYYTFLKQFKIYTGTSPTEYKKKYIEFTKMK